MIQQQVERAGLRHGRVLRQMTFSEKSVSVQKSWRCLHLRMGIATKGGQRAAKAD